MASDSAICVKKYSGINSWASFLKMRLSNMASIGLWRKAGYFFELPCEIKRVALSHVMSHFKDI
jgi:hypothetical protein